MAEAIKELTSENFISEAILSPLPVVIDVWAPWCRPCFKVMPILEALAEEYEGKVLFMKLNVDEETDFIRETFPGLLSIPTILFFNSGKLLFSMMGAMDRESYVEALEALIEASQLMRESEGEASEDAGEEAWGEYAHAAAAAEEQAEEPVADAVQEEQKADSAEPETVLPKIQSSDETKGLQAADE